MPTLLDQMVEARLGWTSTAIGSWYAEADLRQQLRGALAAESDRTDNAAFGREYRDGSGLVGVVDPLGWSNRRIELPDGGWAVTGIRFRARDLTRPFVDVVATTELATADGLAAVAAAVVPAYTAFAPLCLRVDVPDASGLAAQTSDDPRFGPHCSVDMHVVAGLVDELRGHPRATSYPRVTLRPGDAQQSTERVSAIYAELAAVEPDLATWASPADAESLAACAEAGLLFEVIADGVHAGVVAALRDDAHAMTGFAVQELCLDAAHRGLRMAPAAVQRLVDELPAQPRDVLWGTIHPANAPSLRNAVSVGRVLVGGYAWVTPKNLPGMPPSVVGGVAQGMLGDTSNAK